MESERVRKRSTMSGGGETGVKFAGDDNKAKIYEPKQHKKIIRLLTVMAYVFSVSLAAILLSLYYVFLWDPKPAGNKTQIAPTATSAVQCICTTKEQVKHAVEMPPNAAGEGGTEAVQEPAATAEGHWDGSTYACTCQPAARVTGLAKATARDKDVGPSPPNKPDVVTPTFLRIEEPMALPVQMQNEKESNVADALTNSNDQTTLQIPEQGKTTTPPNDKPTASLGNKAVLIPNKNTLHDQLKTVNA